MLSVYRFSQTVAISSLALLIAACGGGQGKRERVSKVSQARQNQSLDWSKQDIYMKSEDGKKATCLNVKKLTDFIARINKETVTVHTFDLDFVVRSGVDAKSSFSSADKSLNAQKAQYFFTGPEVRKRLLAPILENRLGSELVHVSQIGQFLNVGDQSKCDAVSFLEGDQNVEYKIVDQDSRSIRLSRRNGGAEFRIYQIGSRGELFITQIYQDSNVKPCGEATGTNHWIRRIYSISVAENLTRLPISTNLASLFDQFVWSSESMKKQLSRGSANSDSNTNANATRRSSGIGRVQIGLGDYFYIRNLINEDGGKLKELKCSNL